MKEAGGFVLYNLFLLFYCVKWGRKAVNRAEVVTSSSPLLFQLQVRTHVLGSLYLKSGPSKYVLPSPRERSPRT